jgi:hypothetical protein
MVEPYSREFFAPRPSRAVLFLRTFAPWQLLRFAVINFRMIRMLGKAHAGVVEPAAPHRGDRPGAAA